MESLRKVLKIDKKQKMIKKKLQLIQNEKNEALKLSGLKLKSMPRFGYGR